MQIKEVKEVNVIEGIPDFSIADPESTDGICVVVTIGGCIVTTYEPQLAGMAYMTSDEKEKLVFAHPINMLKDYAQFYYNVQSKFPGIGFLMETSKVGRKLALSMLQILSIRSGSKKSMPKRS